MVDKHKESEPSKRNHEGDGAVGRRKLKKTAFFRPGNNLTGSKTTNKPTVRRRSDSSNHKEVVPASLSQEEVEEPVKEPEYDRFISINQSSDESFEGVKWKVSPVKHGKTSTTPASSPLKNMLPGSDPSEADQAESMLLKYGSGFLNITSQTPKVVKSNSDLSFDSFDMLDGGRPSLQRATSLMDFGEKEEKNGSSLTKWISKFDDEREAEKGHEGAKMEDGPLASDIGQDLLDTKMRERETKGRVLRLAKRSISTPVQSTPFGRTERTAERMTERTAERMAERTTTTATKTATAATETAPASKPSDDSDDPFSDEEEFMASYAMKSKSVGRGDTPAREGLLGLHFDSSTDLSTDLSNEYTKKLQALAQIKEQSPSFGAKFSYTRPDLRRYQIIKQLTTSFKTSNRNGSQKILTVKDAQFNESKLIVRGEYTTLNMVDGDVINLVITHPETPTLVDDSHNLLIWHPDVLVSATTVSQQLDCARKPVLKDRFNFPGDTSVPLLVGVMLHEIFQACFSSETWTMEFMEKMMDQLIQDNLIACFSIECSAQEIKTEMMKSLPYLGDWFKQYYKRKGKLNQMKGSVHFCVNKALDIEEHIWSPLFGIKGKVDVTLEAQVDSADKNGTFLIPMEIKTGREYLSHHAQSSLYGLLFKDRYDMDVNSFLLVYTKEKISKMGEVKPSELRALVNLRNRIAEFLLEGVRELPPVIKRSICERCEVQTECMTLHHLLEDGTEESSGVGGAYTDMTEHLDKQVYKDFYNYWDILITKEESLLKRLKKEIWVMTSKEREEKSGKALAGLVIIDSSETSGSFGYSYTLARAHGGQSLQSSQVSKHDRVIISDEEGHFTIANAFITVIRPHMVVIAADRRIINSAVKMANFNKVDNQKYESVLSGSKGNGTPGKTFRIDKDEMFHGMGLARYNILNLFLKEGDVRRRQQIVELQPPRYTDKRIKFQADTNLNSDQQKAFNRVLSTEDYSLILGMPGTGKTTLIAGLINHLAKQGKSVLLASYTHSAVDNILVKVKEYDIPILRIGSATRVHKDIKQFVPQNITSYEQYTKAYMDPLVVGVTCLGINDGIFNKRNQFDYCIIDEASQVSFPISLGPLRFCDKFILVGDHNQLPPLVQHPDAIMKKELSHSLFQFLNDKFPESVTELTYQYRMCTDIMKLSNVLIYNNLLKCGSETVANQTLKIPNPLGYTGMVTGGKDFWMKWVLNENNKVIFLDHDLVPGYETSVGEKTENHTEVQLIWQIIEALTLCGVPQESIGVMSLYRAQLRLLKRHLLEKENIEVMTADQFQGRDKECVVISLVRSNKEKKVGDLLQEWRRINVAITRSKSKLIILGSKSTLSQGGGVLQKFIELIHKEKWMYKLPPNAVSHYTQFDPETSSQRSVLRNSKTNSPLTQKMKPTAKVLSKTPLIRDLINEIN